LTAAALGADLYGGTSGVALFLSYLFRETSDPRVRRTALGALEHALSRSRDVPPGRSCALYTGGLGIAVVAVRCGAILKAESIWKRGVALAKQAVRHAGSLGDDDLISGKAGALVGFLGLAAELDDEGYLRAATEIGQQLRDVAPTLTGMAHGAAGMIHALIELSVVTGDEDVRGAAARLASYEDRWFDAGTANWSDLREGHLRAPDDIGARSGIAWCHGAPGIVLARRRNDSFPQDVLRETTQAGLRMTERWVRAAIATRPGNYSLCHGLTGNVEALLEYANATGAGAGVASGLAHQVAELGAAEHGSTGVAWPCGTPGGETPALMIGLAGIGYFYLRLRDPRIPSILAPGSPAPGLTAAPP